MFKNIRDMSGFLFALPISRQLRGSSCFGNCHVATVEEKLPASLFLVAAERVDFFGRNRDGKQQEKQVFHAETIVMAFGHIDDESPEAED